MTPKRRLHQAAVIYGRMELAWHTLKKKRGYGRINEFMKLIDVSRNLNLACVAYAKSVKA